MKFAQKLAVAVLVAMSLVSLLLFAYLGLHSRPMSDDHCHILTADRLNLLDYLLYWRDHVDGSFSDYMVRDLLGPRRRLFQYIRDQRFRSQDNRRDGGGVFDRATGHLGGIGNSRFDHVAVFADYDVEAYPMVAALGLRTTDILDDDRAIFADVRGRVRSVGVG